MIDNMTLLEMARQLVEARTAGEFLAVVAQHLTLHVGCDDLLWLETDFASHRFESWRHSTGGLDGAVNGVMPLLFDHPAIQSYVARPDDLAPRRLTDVAAYRAPSNLEALRVSRAVLGRHQLSGIVHVDPAGQGRGWILTREDREFTPAQLDAMARVQPLLVAMDRVHMPLSAAVRRAGSTAAAAGIVQELTDRERQVLDLLVGGLTAHAIGTVLGISPRTVSKHLQNAYAKLGHHDRLVVARDLAPVLARVVRPPAR